MFARAALVCLLSAGAIAGPAGSDALVVYLRNEPLSADVLRTVKSETGNLMRSAGYRVDWSSPAKPVTAENGPLIVVEFEKSQLSTQRLAYTAVENGKVLPFSTVDYTSLWNLLAPVLENESKARRDFLYGRAIARVLAHELYHAVTGAREHSHAGVAEPVVSAKELLADKFLFSEEALSLFRPPAGSAEDDVEESLESGR
jgi:hypothetical protein